MLKMREKRAMVTATDLQDVRTLESKANIFASTARKLSETKFGV
jgi:hypothetical protein